MTTDDQFLSFRIIRTVNRDGVNFHQVVCASDLLICPCCLAWLAWAGGAGRARDPAVVAGGSTIPVCGTSTVLVPTTVPTRQRYSTNEAATTYRTPLVRERNQGHHQYPNLKLLQNIPLPVLYYAICQFVRLPSTATRSYFRGRCLYCCPSRGRGNCSRTSREPSTAAAAAGENQVD